jgi:uroporphyrinogen-III decarboxylase
MRLVIRTSINTRRRTDLAKWSTGQAGRYLLEYRTARANPGSFVERATTLDLALDITQAALEIINGGTMMRIQIALPIIGACAVAVCAGAGTFEPVQTAPPVAVQGWRRGHDRELPSKTLRPACADARRKTGTSTSAQEP